MSHSDAAGRGDRDHPEPAQIDVAATRSGVASEMSAGA